MKIMLHCDKGIRFGLGWDTIRCLWLKVSRRIVLLCLLYLVGGLATSCSVVPTPYGYAAMMGGKGALSSQRDGSVKFAYDNEDSFRSAAALAALGVGAWQSVAAARSADALSATQAGEATKQQAASLAAEVQQAEIAAGVTKSTTLNPNVIPK